MGVTKITSAQQFRELVSGDKPVIIDFWATWCGPCRVISPIFEQLSESEDTELEFASVDVDAVEEVTAQQNIRAMPTFRVLQRGSTVNELVGANPAKLKEIVAKYAK